MTNKDVESEFDVCRVDSKRNSISILDKCFGGTRQERNLLNSIIWAIWFFENTCASCYRHKFSIRNFFLIYLFFCYNILLLMFYFYSVTRFDFFGQNVFFKWLQCFIKFLLLVAMFFFFYYIVFYFWLVTIFYFYLLTMF